MANLSDEDMNLFAEDEIFEEENNIQAAQGVNRVEEEDEINKLLNFDLNHPGEDTKKMKTLLDEIGKIMDMQLEGKRILNSLQNSISRERSPSFIVSQVRIRQSLDLGLKVREDVNALVRQASIRLTREVKILYDEVDERLREEGSRLKRSHLEILETRNADRKEYIAAVTKLQAALTSKLRERPSLSPERRRSNPYFSP